MHVDQVLLIARCYDIYFSERRLVTQNNWKIDFVFLHTQVHKQIELQHGKNTERLLFLVLLGGYRVKTYVHRFCWLFLLIIPSYFLLSWFFDKFSKSLILITLYCDCLFLRLIFVVVDKSDHYQIPWVAGVQRSKCQCWWLLFSSPQETEMSMCCERAGILFFFLSVYGLSDDCRHCFANESIS